MDVACAHRALAIPAKEPYHRHFLCRPVACIHENTPWFENNAWSFANLHCVQVLERLSKSIAGTSWPILVNIHRHKLRACNSHFFPTQICCTGHCLLVTWGGISFRVIDLVLLPGALFRSLTLCHGHIFCRFCRVIPWRFWGIFRIGDKIRLDGAGLFSCELYSWPHVQSVRRFNLQ